MSNSLFEQQKFIEHLIGKHGLNEISRGATFSIFTLQSICDYATTHFMHSKDAAVYFLLDTIPETEFAEVAAYFADDYLTEAGKAAKASYWQEQEQDINGRVYYNLDCMDADIGDRYLTAEQLQKATGAADPLSEKDIIKIAANYEATLYRYNRDADGNYINQSCLYDCMDI